MRSAAFAVAYWALSIFYALLASILALVPGRGPMAWAIRLYTRRMLWTLSLIHI